MLFFSKFYPSFLFFLFFLSLFFLSTSSSLHSLRIPNGVEVDGERNPNEVLQWKTRRSMEEDAVLPNASLILAKQRTTRKDPLDHFNRYNGGWNISDEHYLAVNSLYSFI